MSMLVRGAVDLVNHLVDEAMRQRALKAHLASCWQAAPASKGKRQPPVHPGQGDLFGQARSPSTTAPSPLPSVRADLPPPEDIDALPACNGLPWTDEEVRQLAAHFLSGESVDRRATRLQRTPAAILGKLAVIASTRRDVKQRMLEIALRRSGWARPLDGDEAMPLRGASREAPTWIGNGLRHGSESLAIFSGRTHRTHPCTTNCSCKDRRAAVFPNVLVFWLYKKATGSRMLAAWQSMPGFIFYARQRDTDGNRNSEMV